MGVLDRFNEIFPTGDTGNGYRSWLMLQYYGHLAGKYKILCNQKCLCPRHGGNMCDPEGGRAFSAVANKMKMSWVETASQARSAMLAKKRKNVFVYVIEPTYEMPTWYVS